MEDRLKMSDYEKELDYIRTKAIHDSLTKYRFYFSGLVFAILSYSIQKPIDSPLIWLNILESASWLLFATSGIMSLKECGGLSKKLTEGNVYQGLSPNLRLTMYVLFLIALGLLVLPRIIAKFCA